MGGGGRSVCGTNRARSPTGSGFSAGDAERILAHRPDGVIPSYDVAGGNRRNPHPHGLGSPCSTAVQTLYTPSKVEKAPENLALRGNRLRLFLLGLFDFLAVTVVAFGHGVNRVEVVRACALQKLQWLRRLSCGLTKSKRSESSTFRNDFYAQHAEPRISRPRTSSSSLALEVLRRR